MHVHVVTLFKTDDKALLIFFVWVDFSKDMRDLTRIVRASPQNTDGSIYHIEVQGGKILHDFVREIDSKYGMSLPCMGNYAGQTIAGIISTSTHGTGQDYPTMVSCPQNS